MPFKVMLKMNEILLQLQTIASANAQVPEPPDRFNPRPPGVIQAGSASDAVLKYLRAQVGFRSEAQILWVTGRSHSAVSWSLLYLIGQGLVEARPDPLRNARYKKYRLKPQEQ